MTRLIRMLMQVFIAWLLAWGPIAAIWENIGPETGLTEETLVNWATIFAIGLLVGLSEWAKRTRPTAVLLEWWNLIISWGQSSADPEYVPRKAVNVGDYQHEETSPGISDSTV